MLLHFRKSGVAALFLFASSFLHAQMWEDAAIQYFQQQADKYGLSPEDLSSLAVTDHHCSSPNGLTHVYLQQHVGGLPVEQGRASVHFSPDGEVAFANNGLVPKAFQKINRSAPELPLVQALEIATVQLGLELPKVKSMERNGSYEMLSCEKTKTAETMTVSANLHYELVENGSLRLCWRLVVPDGEDTWAISIDAENGREVSRHNWLQLCRFDKCSNTEITSPHHTGNRLAETRQAISSAISFEGKYNIFPMPLESPLSGNRSLKNGTDIIDATASVYGWHDTATPGPTPEFEYTRGNNVYAYYAPMGTPTTPTPTPIERNLGLYTSGIVPWPDVELEFNYNHDLNSPLGTTFIEDAVTNLFVWNNMCHDVYYRYGFTEAAGNFQATNITGNGLGGDYVRARAQDGSGLNNAGFFTPPEPPIVGQNPPFMRMFLWDTDMPNRILDGDFDNAIIAHEYGHGVSIRLVGGPSNNACLTNFEQGGEGWSDYFALMLTLRDANGNGTLEQYEPGEGIRSMGAYVLGENENGEGIRPAYYSTDMSMDCTEYCNGFTYGDVPDMVQPHGTGFVWCSMLWEMTWELINQYGFEPNIYNTSSTAGNIRAMKIVVEGLKLTACNPTFPQMRDAILAANQSIYGGEGKDKIWAAFARRGLGYSATSPGNESFDNPTMLVTKVVDKETAEVGESVTYTISVKNNAGSTLNSINISDEVPANLTVTSISDGGTNTGGIINWTIPTLANGATATRNFSGVINASSWTITLAEYPVETPISPEFAPAGLWIPSSDLPNPNSNSTTSWWHLNPATITDASLLLTLNLDGSKNNHLSFWHFFDLEPTRDGGVVEVFEGGQWVDLGTDLLKNGYNKYVVAQLISPIGVPISTNPLNGRRAFSGYSGGYVQTVIDLTGHSGTTIIRFRLGTNDSNVTSTCHSSPAGCDGWFLDDFKVLDLKHLLNTANVTASPNYAESGNVGRLGTVYFEAPLPVELTWFNAQPFEKDILLNWTTASELNNAGFELQRRSELEWDFSPIAWVEGHGNSLHPIDYQYFDKNVEPNLTYYYRLRQIDFNGQEQYSDVASAIIRAEGQGVGIFPNPSDVGGFFMQLERPSHTPVDVEVVCVTGQAVAKWELSPGQFRYHLEHPDLAQGIYLVKVKMEDVMYFERLVVQ